MQLGKICMRGPGLQGRAARTAIKVHGHERPWHRVVDHIHDNPTGDLWLDGLADVAALGRFPIHRVSSAIMGDAAANTVRRMRLHRAATALVQGTDTVSAIAIRVGKPQLASFTRAFEKPRSTVASRGLCGRFGHMAGVRHHSSADVKPAELRSHAGPEAQTDLAPDPALEDAPLPADHHDVLTFTGPYVGLPAAHDQTTGIWLPRLW